MFAFFACFFLFLEWSIDWFEVPQYISISPQKSLRTSAADLPRLMQYTYITGLETVLGFVVAICLAIPLRRLLFRISCAKRCIHSSSAWKWSLKLLCPLIHFLARLWPAPKSHYCLFGMFLPDCSKCDSGLWPLSQELDRFSQITGSSKIKIFLEDSDPLCSTSVFCGHQVCCHQCHSWGRHCRIHW